MRERRLGSVLVLAIAAVVVLGGAPLVIADSGVSVGMSPESVDVDVGESVTFDIVVEGADDVGAYATSIDLSDPEAAEITDVTVAGDPLFESDDPVAADGSSAELDVVYGDDALESDGDEVAIATVTVEATSDGTSTVETTLTAIGDEDGSSYSIVSPVVESTVDIASGAGDAGSGSAGATGSTPSQPDDSDPGLDEETDESDVTVPDDGVPEDPDDDDLEHESGDTTDEGDDSIPGFGLTAALLVLVLVLSSVGAVVRHGP